MFEYALKTEANRSILYKPMAEIDQILIDKCPRESSCFYFFSGQFTSI